MQTRFNGDQYARYQVFTTLDLELQQAAVEAINVGMERVDKLLAKKVKGAKAQAALVALDPHTGEVRAAVGGRNYNESQLNRVLAMRQPGSVFKPFVYAAAMNTALRGGSQIFTPASVVDDSPTTFTFGKTIYEPGNYKESFNGPITLRRALMRSANVATVKVAEGVGYKRIVEIARAAGLNDAIQATPAVALGAYEATPLEIAGAYTMFANGGVYVRPTFISQIRDSEGKLIYSHTPERRQVLKPSVNYLMVSMLQDVVNSGTGAGARARGFRLPAAGKTGTSRDGWFAGFTHGLLCVVWVGFDDNRELGLEGSKSGLPIWTEFMKRAAKIRKIGGNFKQPSGLAGATIDPESGQLATDLCPDSRNEIFIAGTQPGESCTLHTFDSGSNMVAAGYPEQRRTAYPEARRSPRVYNLSHGEADRQNPRVYDIPRRSPDMPRRSAVPYEKR
jgi:penicillin-binding protein 1B